MKTIESANERICGEDSTKEIFHPWKLLRYGDRCVAVRDGVEVNGIVLRIIRLSSGKNLIVVADELGSALGMYDASFVFPANVIMTQRRMTNYELQLQYYEPKGMSTSISPLY